MAVILTKGIISTIDADLYLTIDTGDARYYIKSAVNTISGSLQDQIDDITGLSGIIDHSLLSNLDYANAGHTGFQPAGDYATTIQLTTTSGDIVAQIPSDYYTQSEITTISGDIVDQIPAAYTDENAQDAVGTIMSGAGSVTVVYDDSASTITISGTVNDGTSGLI